MAKITVGFRMEEEDKDYISDLTMKIGVPMAKILRDLSRQLRDGALTYDGNEIKAVETKAEEVKAEEKAEIPQKIPQTAIGDIDVTELIRLAKARRVTPQSILDNALKPYRNR